ncbi:MAG: lipopolysaccharide biosynthesis protein [Janthinobacterium lividum]
MHASPEISPGPGPSGTFGSVLRNIGWLLAGKGVGAVLSLVYLALTARTLRPEAFGQFTLILATGQAIAALVSFQSWQIVVRHGMAHLAAGRFERLGRVVAFCTAIDFAAAGAGCVLSTIGVLLLGPVLGWSAALSHTALAFCVVMLLSVRSTPVGVLRLFDRFAVGAAADATTPIMRFAGSLVVVAIHPSITGFLIAWGAAEIATSMVYWFMARRVAAPSVSLPTLHGAWQAPSENAGLWRFTWMTNAGTTLEAVGKQFGVLIVGLATGPVAAGNYRLAFQLSQSIARISDMAARAMFAELARAHVRQVQPAIQHLVRQLTHLAIAAGGVVVVVVVLGPPALRLIAGDGHAGATLPLQLLGCAAAVDLAAVGFQPLLIAVGHAGRALLLQAAATLCLVVAMVILLPPFGAVGMAAAMLIASTCAAILFGIAAMRVVRTS